MTSDYVNIYVNNDENFDKVVDDYDLFKCVKNTCFCFYDTFMLPIYLNKRYRIHSVTFMIFTDQKDNRNVSVRYHLEELDYDKNFRPNLINESFTYKELKKYLIK